MEPLDTVTEVHTTNIELLERLHPLDQESTNSDYLTATHQVITAVEREERGPTLCVGLSDSEIPVPVEKVE